MTLGKLFFTSNDLRLQNGTGKVHSEKAQIDSANTRDTAGGRMRGFLCTCTGTLIYWERVKVV